MFMFSIIGALLGGWILQLFGFDAVVQTGMLELFGKTISTTGYYFMFGGMGALKSITKKFGVGLANTKNLQAQADDLTAKLKKK
uniref:Holin n=1 Tax=Bacillus phage KoopaTroopa TaxID=3234046 RepID=A0AB39C7A0_9CAUD